MEIRTLPTTQLGTAAAAHLTKLLAERAGKPTLLQLSGGSSLSLLPLIDTTSIGPHITIAVLDDRYSQDPAINNFSQIAETSFFLQSIKQGAQAINTRVAPNESLESHGERFNQALTHWRTNHPDGQVIATVGIGPDGHVAGIMPYPETPDRFLEWFDEPGVFAVGYEAVGKNEFPERTTVTLPWLRSIEHVVSFVKGEDKRPALKRVLAPDGDLATTPARILRNLPDVAVYTDLEF